MFKNFLFFVLVFPNFTLCNLAVAQHDHHHHHMHKEVPTPSIIEPKLFDIKESVLINSCKESQAGLIISFLKVGLGDSILVTCPGGKDRALIDAGDSNANYPGAESLFYEELIERLGKERKIRTLINTHPHSDHTYNFLSLIESGKFSIEKYIDNGGNYVPSDLEEKIRKKVKSKGINYIDAFKERVKSLDICPGVKDLSFEFVWLSDDSYEELGCPQNLNDCSLVTRVSYQGVTILLLADASEGWERKALREGKLKKETIVKVGHHGSLVSVYPEAWKVMNPELAVISAGEQGKGRSDDLGYPAEETANELKTLISSKYKSTVSACRKSGMRCDWQKIEAPITSTQNKTSDLFLSDGKLCQSEK